MATSVPRKGSSWREGPFLSFAGARSAIKGAAATWARSRRASGRPARDLLGGEGLAGAGISCP